MKVRQITFIEWNNLEKPDIADSVATEKDICYKIGNYYLHCETYKDVNNLVCFLTPVMKPNIKNCLKALYRFCYIIATEHNIKYAKVKGRPGKYGFLKRVFADDVFCEKELIDGEQVLYVHFSEKAIEKLKALSEDE